MILRLFRHACHVYAWCESTSLSVAADFDNAAFLVCLDCPCLFLSIHGLCLAKMTSHHLSDEALERVVLRVEQQLRTAVAKHFNQVFLPALLHAASNHYEEHTDLMLSWRAPKIRRVTLNNVYLAGKRSTWLDGNAH